MNLRSADGQQETRFPIFPENDVFSGFEESNLP